MNEQYTELAREWDEENSTAREEWIQDQITENYLPMLIAEWSENTADDRDEWIAEQMDEEAA